MRNKPRKSIAEKVREWIQFALLLVVSIWGIYTFVYKEIIVPAHRSASLEINGDLEQVGRVGDLALIRARIHVANTRDTRIYAPALWFTVTGLEIKLKESSDQGQGLLNRNGLTVEIANYSEQKEYVIAAWRFQDWRIWYEPSDETSNDYLFYVPLDRYEVIQLKLEVIVTKSIDELASVQWDNQTGVFIPTIIMKGRDNQEEPFDPENRQHKNWEERSGVAHNWFVTTLSLLPEDDGQSP